MRTDDISLADALAFESFTEEQKRIAFAGVALHDLTEAAVEAARREGFDAGMAAGRAEALREDAVMAEQEVEWLRVQLIDLDAALRDVRSTIQQSDTRYEMVGRVLARIARIKGYVEGDR